MNNEPVAYGKYLEEHDYWVTASGIIPNPKEGYVPLYTHPAKTLTDEKIEVYKEALEKLARLGNGDEYGNSIGNDIAIDALRKAQE